jgi:two-component system, chemotaxis family, CheB/CheR fusion protein
MHNHGDGAGSTRAGSVLIVDPDEQARAGMAEALSRLGFPLVQLESAEDALRVAKDERPAAVISEVVLPTSSGYELCRLLKQRYGDDFPVVFVSGRRTDAVDRVAGLLIGADDYLVKPVHPDELLVRVGRLIQQRERATPPYAGLTPREHEVLQLMTDGCQPAEIAARLVITPRTVAKHTEHILAKLGVQTRAQAVAVALRDEIARGGHGLDRLLD